MFNKSRFTFALIALLTSFCAYASDKNYTADPFLKIDSFASFISDSKLEPSSEDGDRVLVNRYIELSVKLKSKPVEGRYFLIETLLEGLDISEFDITHSVFIGAEDGAVLNAYVEKRAVEDLINAEVDGYMKVKALHVYNFKRGPRLIILASQA